MTDTAERRNNSRLPLRILVEYDSSEDFLIDYTANMSIGGMFIQTGEPLPVGTRFRLRFRIPGREEPVDTEGEVCWLLGRDEAGPMHPGMGIRFSELTGSDKALIERMLAEWQ